ncbi:MAG: FAD:protein FMN transferase [Saprospiraceae bacterium]
MILYEGKTMGTSYHIRIYSPGATDEKQLALKKSTDSLLYWINQGISSYEQNSLVTFFNKTIVHQVIFPNDDTTRGTLKHFFRNLQVGKNTFLESHGYFDPTVMKLVNYWGFGYSGRSKIETPDSVKIKEILRSTGMNKISFSYNEGTGEYTLTKLDSLVELDFGGIGQGYGADQIADLLNYKGYGNYLVEVGGELVAKGTKPDGSLWIVGLNTPLEDASIQDVFSKVKLTDLALTTSGNYRNFYKSGVNTFSHTLNPITGFPERSKLLSVTLIGPNCTDIDAMATACMAVGIDSCKAIVIKYNMEAYFVYRDHDSLRTDLTEGFAKYLTKE